MPAMTGTLTASMAWMPSLRRPLAQPLNHGHAEGRGGGRRVLIQAKGMADSSLHVLRVMAAANGLPGMLYAVTHCSLHDNA